MAGSSTAPLARKLGLTAGVTVALLRAPDGFGATLEGLPDGVVVTTALDRPVDVVVSFHVARADLEAGLPAILDHLDPDGAIWCCWPKRAARMPSDLTEDVIRAVVLPLGLVDVKVVAVSDVWSGLRVVWRRERRPALRAARRRGRG